MVTSPAREDRLFERFGRTGDPELLAEVFDATAPQLLRVAIHLSRDPAEAEDLVQATFVTAMEKARTFEPGRKVMPWLAGILELHARRARGRAARGIARDRVTAPRPVDPEQQALERELDDAVRQGLDRLPEAYRSVLVLKLRHGLAPAQIADALGRSPGAVRVQIHRGLEMLRKHLPVGLALSAACVVTPTRGLAAMRHELLRHAAAAASMSAAANGVLIGSLMMKKLTFAVAAVAIIAAATWILRAEPQSAPAATGGAAPVLAADGAAQPSSAAAVAPPETADAAAPRANGRELVATATSAGGGAIEVHARWADDQSGARGVGLTIRPHDGRHPDLYTRRRVTDGEGVACFLRLPPGTYGIYSDHDASLADDELLDASKSVDTQTLDLSKGTWGKLPMVADRLFVTEQRTNAEAAPVVFRFANAVQPMTLDLTGDVAGGGAQLDFVGRSLEVVTTPTLDQAAKTRLLELNAPSRLPDEEPIAVETVEDAVVVVEIRVARGADVAGRVLGPDDAPVPGAEIWVVDGSRRDAQVVTRADQAGRFELRGLASDTRVFARAAGYAPSPPAAIPDGDAARTALEIRLLARSGLVRGQVVDQRGRAVEDASVRIGDPTDADDAAPPVHLRTDADGRFETVGIPVGTAPVLVLAPGFQPHVQEVQVSPGRSTECLVRMDRGWVASGTVLDENGAGKAGITVHAEAEGKPTTETTSGPDGRFRLECLPPGPVALVVEEGDYRALRVPVHGLVDQEQHRDLQLLPWGRIAGRLLDEHGQPLAHWTVLARPTGDAGAARTATTDSGGAFELKADPELDYRLAVHPQAGFKGMLRSKDGNVWSLAIFAFGNDDGAEPPAGRQIIDCSWIGAVRGATDDLVLSVPAHRLPSARISGRVVGPDGGGLAASLRVYVDGRYRTIQTGADGRFEAGPLIPGAYRFEVVCKDERWAPFDLDVKALSPGQRVNLGDVTPPRR